MSYTAKLMNLSEHREGLSMLWAEDFSNHKIASIMDERMKWLYEELPSGPTKTFVAWDEEAKQIVGCCSLMPRQAFVRGQACQAALGMDFAVSKHHRIGGPAVMLQRGLSTRHRELGFEFVYTYPNKGSMAVLKRVGAKVVGESSSWVKPLRVEYKLRDYVKSKLGLVAASMIADKMLAADDSRLLLRTIRKYKTEVVRYADKRFDDLFEGARDRFGVIPEKGAGYLNWRYANCRTGNYSFFCMTDRAGSCLEGYVVYEVRDNKVFVDDLFCGDMGATAEQLLTRFAIQMRREGWFSIFLTYVGNDKFKKVLEKLRFIQREGSRNLMVHLGKEVPQDRAEAILDKNSWFIFDGELDI